LINKKHPIRFFNIYAESLKKKKICKPYSGNFKYFFKTKTKCIKIPRFPLLSTSINKKKWMWYNFTSQVHKYKCISHNNCFTKIKTSTTTNLCNCNEFEWFDRRKIHVYKSLYQDNWMIHTIEINKIVYKKKSHRVKKRQSNIIIKTSLSKIQYKNNLWKKNLIA